MSDEETAVAEITADVRRAWDEHGPTLAFLDDTRADHDALKLMSAYPRIAEAATGRAPACKEGCSWCCYHRIHVDVVELRRLHRWLMAAIPPEEVAGFAATCIAKGKAVRGATARDHFARGGPCVFLTRERECGVQGARPAVCPRTIAEDPFHPAAVKYDDAGRFRAFHLGPRPRFSSVYRVKGAQDLPPRRRWVLPQTRPGSTGSSTE